MGLIQSLPLEFYTVSTLVNLITSLSLAVFICWKNPRSNVGRTFSYFLLTVSFWSFFYLLFLRSERTSAAEFYLRTCMIGVIFMPSTFAHFVWHFLNLKSIKKKIINLDYFISAMLACLVNTPFFAKDFRPFLVFPVWGVAGFLLTAHIVQFFVSAVFTHFNMFSVMRKNKGLFGNQIRYVLIGVTVGFLAGGTNYFAWYSLPIPPFAQIFVSVGVATIAYGIVRHRLMDIRIVAIRALLFSLIYVPILSVPYVIGYLLKTSWVFPTILQTVFAPGGLFIYLKIQERAERRMLQGDYENARKIRELARGIFRINDVNELGKVIVEKLSEITRSDKMALYVIDKDRTGFSMRHSLGDIKISQEIAMNDPMVAYFQSENALVMLSEARERPEKTIKRLLADNIVIAVPVLEEGSLLGIIFLGGKPESRAYSHIEITALDVLAKQLAFFIQLIQFIEEKEDMQRAINEAQRMKEFKYLTSSIGHEVGNGIQSIADIISTFFVDPVLRSRFDSDEELQKVIMDVYGDISDNIANLKLVTRSLRNYIREEDPGEVVDVELEDLIKRVIVLLNVRNMGMKGMNVSVEGNANIKGNPGALQAVFYNLLNNCYDAIIEKENLEKDKAPEYAGDIRINICKKNDFAEVRVKDNGIGMNEEVRSRIFTPLFTTKSHEVTKDRRLRGGTGIGMETIKKMVEGHKGRIEIAWSEKGKGAEFLLFFPSGAGGM